VDADTAGDGLVVDADTAGDNMRSHRRRAFFFLLKWSSVGSRHPLRGVRSTLALGNDLETLMAGARASVDAMGTDDEMTARALRPG
jgi:hypothetical protein